MSPLLYDQLFAPQGISCHGCERLLLPSETMLCHNCETDLLQSRIPPPERIVRLDDDRVPAFSAFWYEGMARRMVLSLKYRHDVPAAALLSGAICTVFQEIRPEGRWLATAVPAHPIRLLERGYNQAQLLAMGFCRTMDIPLDGDLLRRIRFEDSQVHRDRKQRYRAMQGAFASTRPLHGENVLLIDDVLTTGATVTACARELRKSGAGEILVLTVCRAEKW